VTAQLPPGWPKGVLPPEVPGWETSAVAWLLDQCPPDLRVHEALRRHPAILAFVASHHVTATRDGMRAAYSGIRRSFDDPADVELALRVVEREGARIAAVLREVELVREALDGRRWRPRL
jgi:hypothetical protein